MNPTQTARDAARHGVKRGMCGWSPYGKGRWVMVTGAIEWGKHVDLYTPDGKRFTVDWDEKLQRRQPTKEGKA